MRVPEFHPASRQRPSYLRPSPPSSLNRARFPKMTPAKATSFSSGQDLTHARFGTLLQNFRWRSQVAGGALRERIIFEAGAPIEHDDHRLNKMDLPADGGDRSGVSRVSSANGIHRRRSTPCGGKTSPRASCAYPAPGQSQRITTPLNSATTALIPRYESSPAGGAPPLFSPNIPLASCGTGTTTTWSSRAADAPMRYDPATDRYVPCDWV